MGTSRIALWYLEQQRPYRERLLELLADYSPAPGELTTDVICRMRPADRSEALDLAAVLAPFTAPGSDRRAIRP